jgi:hypothetical protein
MINDFVMFVDSVLISGCKRRYSLSVWENSSLEVKRKWVARSRNAISEIIKIAKERGLDNV